MDRLLPALFAILLPLGAQAHPHIFVDTALALVTNAAGRPAGVEVTWRYDEFYSLLIFEDMGLDGDYDGTLTEAELARDYDTPEKLRAPAIGTTTGRCNSRAASNNGWPSPEHWPWIPS